MSEFGGWWKHENNQHSLVPTKTECGCPSGGGIHNGDIRYPLLWRNAERTKIILKKWDDQKHRSAQPNMSFSVQNYFVTIFFLSVGRSRPIPPSPGKKTNKCGGVGMPNLKPLSPVNELRINNVLNELILLTYINYYHLNISNFVDQSLCPSKQFPFNVMFDG